jgi:hypothetical protein
MDMSVGAAAATAACEAGWDRVWEGGLGGEKRWKRQRRGGGVRGAGKCEGWGFGGSAGGRLGFGYTLLTRRCNLSC